MLNKGHGADSLVYNNLISGFLELGNLDKANELFDELKERCLVYDGVVNATYMEWFFNNGRDKEAMDSYKSLMDRQFKMTPVTCNVLLEVLLKHGKKTQAWALFDQMLDNHTPPNFQAVNSDTFNIMVNECFNLGKFHEALATFRKAGTKSNSKAFAMDVAGYNNIISRFCENGLLSEAETLFEELCSKSLSPDVPTHRTLIDAYMKMERIDDALKVFHRMVDAGLRVVTNFCNRVFDELIKNDKVIDCAQILSKMGERDPKPDPTCYEVVIRGLCAKGLLDKSLELLYQVMRYGVGVTNSLREFVTEVFKKAGRGDEIERLLDFNTPRYRPPQLTRQPYPTSGSPPQQMQPPSLPSVQMAGVHNPSPGFMPQVAAQEHLPLPPQNTGMHQPSWGVSPPMTGPQMPAAGPSPHTSGLPYSPPSEFQTHMKGVAPKMSANHYTPSAPSPQMAGHQPYGTPSGPQQYPPSGLTPPWGGQHHPQSWSSIPSHGTSAKMSALCNTAPGPSSQMTGPYNPASGIPPHFQEPHQQQSEVPEQVAAWNSS